MGRTALADFTNTKNVGELSITKTVGGNAGDLGKEFTFVVDLTLPGGGTDPGTYPYTGHGVPDGPVANSGTDPGTCLLYTSMGPSNGRSPYQLLMMRLRPTQT